MVKNEDKEKRSERHKMKPPTFLEKETWEEFRRKYSEFETYLDRSHLKANEITEDLYHACETPLKRKLRSSHLIDKNQLKKTDPKVLLAEMERMCLPKLNIIVEREQFKRLEQDEEESINDFESRVRSKAYLCEFNRCKQACKQNCIATAQCGFSREEDDILAQILCRMKDKDLQKELWR